MALLIFKIALIILVALPVIALSIALFMQVADYVKKLNTRDRRMDPYKNDAKRKRR